MKHLACIILAALAISSLLAQPPRRRDTVGGMGSLPPSHIQLLQTPVLINPEQAKTFAPTGKICFDKKFFVKTTGSRPADMYIYLNTTDGIVATITGRLGELGDGEFKTDDRRFRLMVMGKKGNVYNYYNTEKNGSIQHWVATGNTETHLYQNGFTPGNDVIYKKTVRNQYCGTQFKTWSYKADGADAPVFHIYGATYPNKLVCKEMLGYSGVGYLNTDAGIYLVLEMEAGRFSTEVREVKDADICFDASAFKQAEQNMYQELNDEIEKKKQKLDSKPITGDCISEKQALKNHKKQLLDKQKRQLEQIKRGNVYQDKNVQKAYVGLQDPVDMADQAILEYKVKICGLQQRISRSQSQDNSDLQESIDCYNTKIGKLQAAKAQMQAQDTRFPNDPGKANLEKMKIMGQNMQGCD